MMLVQVPVGVISKRGRIIQAYALLKLNQKNSIRTQFDNRIKYAPLLNHFFFPVYVRFTVAGIRLKMTTRINGRSNQS